MVILVNVIKFSKIGKCIAAVLMILIYFAKKKKKTSDNKDTIKCNKDNTKSKRLLNPKLNTN